MGWFDLIHFVSGKEGAGREPTLQTEKAQMEADKGHLKKILFYFILTEVERVV